MKSLLTFAHEIGYVRFNVGRAIRLPKTRNQLAERDDARQITVHGKGEKTRHVLLSSDTWRELVQLRAVSIDAGRDGPDDAVFESRMGGALSRVQVWNVVRGHSSLATTSQYAHARPGDSSARYLAV